MNGTKGYNKKYNRDDDADEAIVCKECADDNLPDQEDGAALLARKTSFYEELDRRIDALSKVQKNSHILSVSYSMKSTTLCCPSRMHLKKSVCVC